MGCLIQEVQVGSTVRCQFFSFMDRLSASTYTSAWTGHDNCINVSQHALLFLSRFVELKTVFTIALSGKKHNPVFPIFFCRSCPGAVNATRLLLGLSVHTGVKFFQEGMIIPVCFVAWHRVDVDVMNAVENAFFDIRIIPF